MNSHPQKQRSQLNSQLYYLVKGGWRIAYRQNSHQHIIKKILSSASVEKNRFIITTSHGRYSQVVPVDRLMKQIFPQMSLNLLEGCCTVIGKKITQIMFDRCLNCEMTHWCCFQNIYLKENCNNVLTKKIQRFFCVASVQFPHY